MLTPDLLTQIVQRLVESFHPEQIILFGSHAYGEPDENRDVDLFVIVSESDQPRYRRSREAHKSLSGIGISKDIGRFLTKLIPSSPPELGNLEGLIMVIFLLEMSLL